MLKSRCMKIICTVLTANKTTKSARSFFSFIISCKHSWSLSLPPTRTLLICGAVCFVSSSPWSTSRRRWAPEWPSGMTSRVRTVWCSWSSSCLRSQLWWGRLTRLQKEDDLHAVMMKTIQSVTVGYEDSIAISSFCTFSKIHTTSFDVEP